MHHSDELMYNPRTGEEEGDEDCGESRKLRLLIYSQFLQLTNRGSR